jgi:signal transduction histidine kinase
VGELVLECVKLTRVRHNLGADAVSFTESVNGERPQVKADPEELRVAISNLLDNAVKYSVKGVDISVAVAALDEKRVAVRIEDKGIGIPAAQLKRIFKRFYRVPSRVIARIKGTGLGLFIVSSVVARHGGRVFAESEGAGHGSRFTIELPRL